MVAIVKRKPSKQPWVTGNASLETQMLELIAEGVRSINALGKKLNCDPDILKRKVRLYINAGVLETFNNKLYLKPIDENY